MTQTYKDSGGSRLADLLDSRFFKALSDPNRAVLLATLCENPTQSTVTEAAECCSVDISVVSRHLSTLRNAGVIEAEKKGREVHYSVPHASIASTLRSIADAVDACCSPGDGCATGAEEDNG